MTPKEIKELVEKIAQHPDTVDAVAKKFNDLQWFMSVLVVALLIGFVATFIAAGAMLVDSWTNKAATYQNLVNKVDDQKKETDAIKEKSDDNKTLLEKVIECQKKPVKPYVVPSC